MDSINWEEVKAAAFTAIRLEFPVEVLQEMAEGDNETPVSGDALAQRKSDLVKARR